MRDAIYTILSLKIIASVVLHSISTTQGLLKFCCIYMSPLSRQPIVLIHTCSSMTSEHVMPLDYT